MHRAVSLAIAVFIFRAVVDGDWVLCSKTKGSIELLCLAFTSLIVATTAWLGIANLRETAHIFQRLQTPLWSMGLCWSALESRVDAK